MKKGEVQNKLLLQKKKYSLWNLLLKAQMKATIILKIDLLLKNNLNMMKNLINHIKFIKRLIANKNYNLKISKKMNQLQIINHHINH